VQRSQNVTFEGNGTILGHGERWWFYVVLVGPKLDPRPFLVVLSEMLSFTMRGWTLTNSPNHYVRTHDMKGGLFEDITIHTEVDIGRSAMEFALRHRLGVPADWRARGPKAFASTSCGSPGRAAASWAGHCRGCWGRLRSTPTASTLPVRTSRCVGAGSRTTTTRSARSQ